MVRRDPCKAGADGMKTCPACGQVVPEQRAGVRLTPVKVRIFDAVKRAGIGGISSRDLVQVVYEDDRHPRNIATIRAHIWQLNELLAGTDVRIAAHDDRRCWFMTKTKQKTEKWK